ncbi:MAG: VIT domain-containing protein [Phycisphaeraceae bacterium]
MVTTLPDQQEVVPLPLKHTDVRASILGYIATVQVTQQFHNPFNEKIEAAYVFPLPTDAAINEFIMTIGDRKIRGIIRERAEAQRIYHEARAQGYVASLLTQERPNIFTQKVANIEPGKQIDVSIRYFHTLSYDDGWFEFNFPMVVGPRYNPSAEPREHSTDAPRKPTRSGGWESGDGIGAVARDHPGAPGSSRQRTEVTYLRPHERSGHDIALHVEIDAGLPLEQVVCPSHRVNRASLGDGRATIALQNDDTIPNKDFVLRYRLAGDNVRTAMFTQRDDRGGYFTLMLIPPRSDDDLPQQPLEMVFLVDCSGSMSGQPLDRVKDAMRTALGQLRDDDRFQIVCFASQATQMSQHSLPATAGNIRRGLEYVNAIQSGGGTEMLTGITAALALPDDPQRDRIVTLMTDGFIGNEKQIIQRAYQRNARTRIFSFGVGSSSNRYLIEGVAAGGNGAVAYVGPNDDADDVMKRYLARLRRPALTDIRVAIDGVSVGDVYPKRIPDLFAGRPLVITGRFTGDAADKPMVRVTGKVGGQERQTNTPITAAGFATPTALPAVWARSKLSDLAQQSLYTDADAAELGDEVRTTALAYGLMSDYTAFVAVDASRRTEGDHGTTVPVPVPVPEGTRYETTVAE